MIIFASYRGVKISTKVSSVRFAGLVQELITIKCELVFSKVGKINTHNIKKKSKKCQAMSIKAIGSYLYLRNIEAGHLVKSTHLTD